jgi:hypothetical protein
MTQQNYIQAARLPPGWAPNTDIPAVMDEIGRRVDWLTKTNNDKERQFIYALLKQLIKTGHS